VTGVVVVGDGLAAAMAALAAARAGAPVTLVSPPPRKPGPSLPAEGPRPTGGLVGVLGYTPDGDGPLAEPFASVPDLPSDHPYRVVGTDAVREGLALFDDVTGDAYGGEGTERNALVPTAWGRLRPAARYPDAIAAGLASDQLATSLVGFDALPSFDPALAAERLDDSLPYRVNGLTVSFPTALSAGADPGPTDRRPLDCARAFDAAENAGEDSGGQPDDESENGTRRGDDGGGTENLLIEGLQDELDVFLDAKDRVGFPAVLGLEHGQRVRERLAEGFGLDVFEVPLGPPSVPGLRLGALLADALAEAGVALTAADVEGVETSDGRVDAVRLAGGEIRHGEAFVLATGGVADGGLVADRDGLREPVAGCHVDAPENRSAWAAADPLGDHAFARFGVRVDASLRPLARDGGPSFENLRAAGKLLGGYDFVAEGSAGGVSVATGAVAGRLAAGSP
jgi:glycerol-3-phosphate dehydrogenase subunit B